MGPMYLVYNYILAVLVQYYRKKYRVCRFFLFFSSPSWGIHCAIIFAIYLIKIVGTINTKNMYT